MNLNLRSCTRADALQDSKVCRCAAMVLNALAMMALIIVWSAVPSSVAYAYVDPSVMTYTIQAVAGVAVALSAVIGVAFRRTRRKLLQILKVDENADKAVEGSISSIEPSAPDAETRLQSADDAARALTAAAQGEDQSKPRTMKWRARFVFSLVVSVFVAFIIFIAPALEIFGSNGDSLVFVLGVVWWIPVVFCLAIALVVALLVSLLKGRPFYIVLALMFALACAAYVQSLFMNHGMMPADGGFIGWGDWYFVEKMITSGIVWVLIIIAMVVVSIWRPHRWLQVATGLACAIMIVQLVGVGSVAIDASKNAVDEQSKPYVTKGSLLTVSPKSNVIVFVLDTYDTSLLEDVLKENPGFLDGFEDFTYFPDSLGTMIPTTNAVPNLITGLKPEPGQDIGEYRRTKYEKSSFISDISDLGYSIGMYSDSFMFDYSIEADLATAAKTLNIHPVSNAPLDLGRTFIAMEQCALYREAPWVLKPVFWYYTSDINNRMIADAGVSNLDDSLYELDDAAILDLLKKEGLDPVDEGQEGAFRFIHLFGPHFPFSIDENGEYVGTNQSNQLAQAVGSMRVVEEYLAELKELGLYDSATIIVTADHGIWNLSEDPVSAPISPIMIVKPQKDASGERQPVVTSRARVSHDDVQATVIDAMGGDSQRYGSTVFEIDRSDSSDRVRYFDALTNAGGEGQRFVEYAVSGNVSDLSTWEKTGNTWADA